MRHLIGQDEVPYLSNLRITAEASDSTNIRIESVEIYEGDLIGEWIDITDNFLGNIKREEKLVQIVGDYLDSRQEEPIELRGYLDEFKQY